ncbi:hypothetical protein HNQ60_003916 [Povalibacter uvarum]|uniref:MobA/VirD2-like nuclease domain-containing protein n=1 Tax=Povalibacter uvarum TaxID=732238 RepID=A0A841HRU9_9GAMM|nr:relaxase/mobilization nuclease domain-containing protein [Povalibacter uvarum]MBB6095029.1 hypothetical protein [Povalibacter uvarum]
MSKLNVSLLEGRPILDLRSYARRGPGHRDRLSPAEIAQISRTVHCAPEVVVKALSKGSNNLTSVGKHFGYIGRYGDLAVETDEGQLRQGRDVGATLLEDWDLDLDEHRYTSDLTPGQGRVAPKLVHKLMLSMPAGTSPDAVFAAARSFLREQFAFKHRYAFVLHTDEPHPHVHAVIKAVSEQGERLHIKKATLREWRQEFARHLRVFGVEANATERAVRGQSRCALKDGIYRAGERGDSAFLREQAVSVASDVLKERRLTEPGKGTLVETRAKVVLGWTSLAHRVASEGYGLLLATDILRFVDQMPPVRTTLECVAHSVSHRLFHSPVQDRTLNRTLNR